MQNEIANEIGKATHLDLLKYLIEAF